MDYQAPQNTDQVARHPTVQIKTMGSDDPLHVYKKKK